MLERYFLKPQTLDRIRGSWLGDSLERYVAWLADQGYRARNVYRRVPLLVQFGEFAREHGATRFEDLSAHVAAFVEARLLSRPHEGRRGARALGNEIRGPIRQFLRLLTPDQAQGSGRGPYCGPPFLRSAPGFFAHLRDERGLRKGSLQQYGFHLRRLEWYLARIGACELAALSPAILSAFVADCHLADEAGTSGKRLGRSSMIGLCCSLRVFLRYLYREGLVARDLSPSIETPRQYRLADLPRSISWEEVRRVLEAVDRRTAVGRRDYAMLLLMVTYGLRGHEVAEMRLDDLDWERGELLVRGKSLRHDRLPIPKDVGEALAGYLCHRPRCSSRRVFLRINAPLQGFIGSSSVCDIVRRALVRAGLHPARKGSHLLRHGLAVKMLRGGASLAEIGEILRHELPSTTEIYAKVDVAALRALALPWQGGEL